MTRSICLQPHPQGVATSESLLPRLREWHHQFLAEVQAHIGVARSPEAKPWDRWTAVRYLETDFLLGFRREIDALQSLAGDVSPPLDVPEDAATVEELRERVYDLVRTAGTAEESAAVMNQFYHALCGWCEDAEAQFGGLDVRAVSSRSAALLGGLSPSGKASSFSGSVTEC